MLSKAKTPSIPATLIVNPVSGQGDPEVRRKMVKQIAKKLGWTGRYSETSLLVPALAIAKEEVKKGVQHLIICGGDGSVMEVLEAVAHTKTVIGIVPLGTGNLLARNLDIPLDMTEAMKVALLGNNFQVDVGKANDTYFSIIAGVGLDAEIMHETRRETKDSWGILAYIATGLAKLPKRAKKYEITINKKKKFIVRAKAIMAANMGKVMGGLEVVPATAPQSGSLQLGVIRPTSFSAWINVTVHALLGNINSSPHYDVYNTKQITIRPLRGKILYECDGNNFPPTDQLDITIYPKAVTVMMKPEVIDPSLVDKKEVLLFDFDGTIGNSLELFLQVYNHLALKHRYPLLTAENQERYRNSSAREIVTSLPIPKWKLPLLLAEGRKEFEKHFSTIKPFPEIQKTLEILAKKYTLGIVTSNNAVEVKKFLIQNNLDNFNFVYSDKSIFGKGKIIRKVIRKYKFTINDVIYVGDEVRDIDAAREAGIKVISVTWGFNSRESLKRNDPDFLVSSPHELTTISPFRSD